MSRWTLVPIRSLATGKSRLAQVLDREERARLNHALLDCVLDAVEQADGTLSRCIVASAGQDALALARSRGAVAMQDVPVAGLDALNLALEAVRARAITEGATSVLVLAADLPDVSALALRRLLTAHADGGPVAVADKHGAGTNGLLLPASCTVRFAFGEHSLARHLDLLRGAGFEPVVWHDQALAFDLDSPEDFETWMARCPHALAE